MDKTLEQELNELLDEYSELLTENRRLHKRLAELLALAEPPRSAAEARGRQH